MPKTTLITPHFTYFAPIGVHIKIDSMPIRRIIALAERNSEVDAQCLEEEYRDFWSKKIQFIFGKDGFMPCVLPEVNAFTQFRSFYYYNLAVQNDEFATAVSEQHNLRKAIKYHSFPAILRVLRDGRGQTIQNKLALLENLQPKASTPALLLHVEVYLFESQRNEDGEFEAGRVQACLDSAYTYLILAQHCYQASQADINNVTFALGLAAIFPNFVSFDEAKDDIVARMKANGQQRISEHLTGLLKQAHALGVELRQQEGEPLSAGPGVS